MKRHLLEEDRIDSAALEAMTNFHSKTVQEVAEKVAADRVVVVGMKQNPVVRSARIGLDKAGIKYTYLEYGSYWSKWKPRLAIKLWSGWPTFPQIFVEGKLVGGWDDTKKLLDAGKLK